MYLSPLFLASDQASHLLVIEFLSADSTAGEGQGNMRRLYFPADSTLKGGLLASCRDRCYSPLICTHPHLLVPRIPLPGLFTSVKGMGQILSTVGSGIKVLHLLGSLASGTMLPDGVMDRTIVFVVFACFLLMSQRRWCSSEAPHTMCLLTGIQSLLFGGG